MKAIVRDSYGAADVLELQEVDEPAIGADQVLLRVHGSSVNMGDRLLMRGEPYLMRLGLGLLRPRRRGLGQDVAGRVEAVGAKVTDWEVGDELYGEVTFGEAWAEYVATPAASLARKPNNVTLAEAGSVPLAGMTALQAVRDHGQVHSGQQVLVNGGSGSVGSYAVQVARALGAEVTAVCSGQSADRARELGAARVIDYEREDFTRVAGRFDALIDVAGNRPLVQSLDVLQPTGTYVAIGALESGRWLGPLRRFLWVGSRGMFSRRRVAVCASKPSRENLDDLTELIEAGEVTPTFESRCRLSDLPAVLREFESGQRRGKVLIEMEVDPVERSR